MRGGFSLESPLAKASGAVWRDLGDEVAVLLPPGGNIHTLDGVAARVWSLADGRTVAAIVDELVNEFDAERTRLERDVLAFVGELSAEGLVEPPIASNPPT